MVGLNTKLNTKSCLKWPSSVAPSGFSSQLPSKLAIIVGGIMGKMCQLVLRTFQSVKTSGGGILLQDELSSESTSRSRDSVATSGPIVPILQPAIILSDGRYLRKK